MQVKDSRTIRYALAGFGGIAENRIAREGFGLDQRRVPIPEGVRLVAACDPNPERRIAAEAWGIEWYDSIDEMLEEAEIDAVFVASPNSSHFEIAKKAMLAGKHVLVEKPIATTLEDAMSLQSLSKEKGLSLMTDHMMEFNQLNARSRKLIASGELGRIRHITLHMEFLFGETPEEAGSWRCSQPSQLGGPIGDVGSHCFYMAEYLLDSRITSLRCVYAPRTLDIAVENGAIVEFELLEGVTGTVRVAFNQKRGGAMSTLLNLGYEVYGDQGSLSNFGSMFQLSGHKDEPINQKLVLRKDNGIDVFGIVEPRNIYQGQILAHSETIRQDRPQHGDAAIRNLKTILAAHDSGIAGGTRQGIE